MRLSYFMEHLVYVIYMFAVLGLKLNRKQSLALLLLCDGIMIIYCTFASDYRFSRIVVGAVIAHSFYFAETKK